jgi:RHS repeat-associated protein
LKQVGLGTTATNNNLFKIDYEYGELNDNGTTVDTSKNIGMIAKTTTTIPTTSFVQTFKYDAINRLTEAKELAPNNAQNWKQTFGYDIFGNRNNFTQTVGTTTLATNAITKPTIDQSNNQFTTGQGYLYDFNGNLIQDAEGRSFKFNGDDKQIEVKATNNPSQIIGSYYYDASGARVKKVVGNETTIFVYDAGGALAAEYSTATTTPTTTPTTSYMTTDHLGSPRVITDKNGNIISRRDFMPFGEEILRANSGNDSIKKKFTGYEKDDETNLDFAEARMYQNKHGRFTAVDPLMASASAGNPQTFNRYSYTGNNPISFTDPSGLNWCKNSGGTFFYTGQGATCGSGYDDYDNKQITVTSDEFYSIDGKQVAHKGDLVFLNANGTIDIILTVEGAKEIAAETGTEVRAEADEIATSTAGTLTEQTFAPRPTYTEPLSGMPRGGPLVPSQPNLPTVPRPDTPLKPIETGNGGAAKGGVIITFLHYFLFGNGTQPVGIPGGDSRGQGEKRNDDEKLVYHGTDSNSGNNIAKNGLNLSELKKAGGSAVYDGKGFSVTTDIQTARDWASARAWERGGRPVIIAAKKSTLAPVLNGGSRGVFVDKNELYIKPKDFPKVPGGVFSLVE